MNILSKKEKITLLVVMAIVFCLIFALVLFKYYNFRYNALDLAIYGNVAENTIHGNWLYSTIQGGNYFGDHFEPLLLLLLPFYFLLQSPLILLFFQTLFLVLAGWPLFLIAQKLLLTGKMKWLILFLYLFNPFIWEMALFEFHILPFALFFVFFTFYFYLQNKFNWYLIFLFGSLLVREDVALFIFGLGIVIWLEKKTFNRFVGIAMIGGALWFTIALTIISYINGEAYKYVIYYQDIIGKSFSLGQLDLFLGLFLPFLFLPLLKIKYLIPAFPIYLQYALLGGMGTVVLKGHYATLLLAACFLALIYVLRDFQNKKNSLFQEYLPIFLIVATIYSFIMLGPVHDLPKIIRPTAERQLMSQIIKKIPTNEAVVAGYDFLPYLIKNKELYALNYVNRGYRQYSEKPYYLPPKINYFVFQEKDFITFVVQNGLEQKPLGNEIIGYQPAKFLFDNFSVIGMTDEQLEFDLVNVKKVNFNQPGYYVLRQIDSGQNILLENIIYAGNNRQERYITLVNGAKKIIVQPIEINGKTILNQVGFTEDLIDYQEIGYSSFINL